MARIQYTKRPIVRVQDALPGGTPDPDVLEWVATENRVLITNDRNTMVGFAYERVTTGAPIVALLVTNNRQSIGSAIDDILFVAKHLTERQLEEQVVVFLPFRQ